ncbi:MAG: T9SS type A sorting domain-containing protein, partial [Calditrichaeota bacterium]|nr:T9SS type A sorting domain-containing protein [Calditrichota bacterium]
GLPGVSGIDPWQRRSSYPTGQLVDDNRLQGVVFIDNRFYVSGGANDINRIYILNREGELVSSYPQIGESRLGIKDLAWDGELIWGVADEMVYGFTVDGDSVTSFQGPFDRCVAIAWDPDHELLWISGITTNIHGYDRNGNHEQVHEISRQGLRIYGLAYFPEDDAPLYVFTSPEMNRQVIHKIEPDEGEVIFVKELAPEEGGSASGAFITDNFDQYGCWVFIDIANKSADDRIDIWQLKSNTDWFAVDTSHGVIAPNCEQELELTFNTSGLDTTIEYAGELIFSQDVGGAETVIPIYLTIESMNVVEDDETALPTEFGISSIFPNPFNSATRINFGLKSPAFVEISVYDLSGRMVATLLKDRMNTGSHRLTWDATGLASGVYICRMQAGQYCELIKLTLIK